VPLLAATDPLPARPHRVLVAGTSGAGKTTLAARVGDLLDIPHVEIDALFHGPGWTPRPSFRADVAAVVARPAWVTEYQYGEVRPLLAGAADLLVWLDLPRAQVMWQVTRRTLTRRLRREPLWNGNLEPPLWSFAVDHEHIVRWAWRTHRSTAARVADVLERRPDLPVVRLTSHAEARRWVAGPLARSMARPEPEPPR
jgi:adenylate kinase family enzyme